MRAPMPKKTAEMDVNRFKAICRAGQPGRYAVSPSLYLFIDPRGARYWVLRTTVKGACPISSFRQGTLRDYAYDHIGDMPVDQIGQSHVLTVLTPIWVAKHVTAKRVRQRIERVLHWAKAHGHRTGDNPALNAVMQNVLPAQKWAVN